MDLIALVYKGTKKKIQVEFPNNGTILLVRDRVYRIEDYHILKNEDVVYELINRYFCIPIEKVIEHPFNKKKKFKTLLVKRTFAMGDLVMVNALLQSRKNVNYYLITNMIYKPIITAPNVLVVEENKYSQLISKCDGYIDLDASNARAVINSNSFNFIEIFNKDLGYKLFPKHFNWEIKYKDEDMEYVKYISNSYLKHKKRLYMQFKGSGPIKSLTVKTIVKVIKVILEEGWAIVLIHQQFVDLGIEHPRFFNFTGQTRIEHIVPMMEISTAIFSMVSSACMFANCTKNVKDQFLFVVTGPNLGHPVAGFHPNGHHINLSYRYKTKDGNPCFPCFETSERCGQQYIAQCLATADGEEIAEEFFKGYQAKMIDKKFRRDRFWSAKELIQNKRRRTK